MLSAGYPLYSCPSLLHEQKSILQVNRLCMNCLGTGHFSKEYKSYHRCKKFQQPHHTLPHKGIPIALAPIPPAPTDEANTVSVNSAFGMGTDALMMT